MVVVHRTVVSSYTEVLNVIQYIDETDKQEGMTSEHDVYFWSNGYKILTKTKAKND